MGQVRFLAGVFWVLAVLCLLLGAIAVFSLAGTAAQALGPRAGQNTVQVILASGLPLVLGLALSPLFLWGVLTGLCEIHASQRVIIQSLAELTSATRVAPHAPAELSRRPASASHGPIETAVASTVPPSQRDDDGAVAATAASHSDARGVTGSDYDGIRFLIGAIMIAVMVLLVLVFLFRVG